MRQCVDMRDIAAFCVEGRSGSGRQDPVTFTQNPLLCVCLDMLFGGVGDVVSSTSGCRIGIGRQVVVYRIRT